MSGSVGHHNTHRDADLHALKISPQVRHGERQARQSHVGVRCLVTGDNLARAGDNEEESMAMQERRQHTYRSFETSPDPVMWKSRGRIMMSNSLGSMVSAAPTLVVCATAAAEWTAVVFPPLEPGSWTSSSSLSSTTTVVRFKL